MMLGKRLVLIAGLGFALFGCRGPGNYFLEREIDELINTPGSEVDLSQVKNSEWSRVCVMGPYSTNDVAASLLGFQWDMESASNVDYLDSVTLLAFVAEDAVVGYVDYPMGKGDFSQLGNICIDREKAIVSKSVENRGYLVFSLDASDAPIGQ